MPILTPAFCFCRKYRNIRDTERFWKSNISTILSFWTSLLFPTNPTCLGDVCCSSSFQPPAKCYSTEFGCFSLLPQHSSAFPHSLHHSCSHTDRWSSCPTLQGCCRSRTEPSQWEICCLPSPELSDSMVLGGQWQMVLVFFRI